MPRTPGRDHEKPRMLRPEPMHTIIESIGTANPQYSGSQKYGAEFMLRVESLSDAIKKRIPAIYDRSGIDTRYSCVGDYLKEPEDFDFFPPNWRLKPPPTTAARNKRYRAHAVPVAEEAARRALADSGRTAADVTHLICVSCTGFFAPGLDVELVKRLELRPATQRTMIGFMGCYAAFNGLRTAHAFCRSDPSASVLLVCVELCTLHFNVDDSLESAVVNALFSDGAAAAVISSADAAAGGELSYRGGASLLDDDSMDHMTWDIGDHGFEMGLSSRVPQVIGRHVRDFVVDMLSQHKVPVDHVGGWAIHPGGRLIVECVQEAFGLTDDDIFDSLEVLRRYGNMSSPTILFVLKRFLDRMAGNGETAAEDHVVALAFGPGLTLEGCLFSRL